MATILYPTRGGESSYPNQDRVIAMAREQDANLVLLYVSSVRFLDRMASPVRVDLLEAELGELGEFLLAMAQERAEKAGVQADAEVRHGVFRQALKEVIQERSVTSVVLGGPGKESAITTVEYLNDLTRFLQTESGVEVIVVHKGEIVQQHPALGAQRRGSP